MSEAIWLASYPAGVRSTIDPDAFPSLHALLLAACEHHPTARLRFPRRHHDVCGVGTRERGLRGLSARAARPQSRATASPSCCRTCWPIRSRSSARCAPGSPWSASTRSIPRASSQHQLVDCGATTIVIMENFAHKLAAVIAETSVEHVVVARLGDLVPRAQALGLQLRQYLSAPTPCRAWRFERFTHAAGRLQPAAVAAAAGPRRDSGRSGGPAIHRRHDRRRQGRDAVASQPGRQHAAMPDLDRHAASMSGVERVLTPLPLYHIFSLTANMLTFAWLGGIERAGARSARHSPPDRDHAAHPRHRHVGRQHAVQRARPTRPNSQQLDFWHAEIRDRRRRGGAEQRRGSLARRHRAAPWSKATA